MSKKKCKSTRGFNNRFIDSAIQNNATYMDYFYRIKKIATSMFEWVNLPDSMNQRKIEEDLFYFGVAAFLYDEKYGFINTQCSSAGYTNIYGLPTKLNCFAYSYQTTRKNFIGLNELKENKKNEDCILVMNNYDRIPTISTIQLFAYRLYQAEEISFVNITAQKTPVVILTTDKMRLTMENLYSQYEGNRPIIVGDKEGIDLNNFKSLKTDSPFIADKIMEYKQEIWNEVLTFLGINNIMINKKERLTTNEANENNELINYNLQSFLVPRLEACKLFNKKFGLEGTDKEISVKIRSDLDNLIKSTMQSDYINKEGVNNE